MLSQNDVLTQVYSSFLPLDSCKSGLKNPLQIHKSVIWVNEKFLTTIRQPRTLLKSAQYSLSPMFPTLLRSNHSSPAHSAMMCLPNSVLKLGLCLVLVSSFAFLYSLLSRTLMVDILHLLPH